MTDDSTARGADLARIGRDEGWIMR
jgi:hypothetical protein